MSQIGNEKQHFDVIVIGSSPVLLIEALHLESQGYKVAIFEKKSHLGGAWSTKSLWGYDGIEVGCHLIGQSRMAYDFLRNLDINLQPTQIHCLQLPPQKDIQQQHSSWAKIVQSMRLFVDKDGLIPNYIHYLLEYLREKKIKSFLRQFIDIIIYRQPTMYPKYGCSEIIESLTTNLKRSSITILNNTTVDAIHLTENSAKVKRYFEDKMYTSNCVVTGQNVDIDIYINDLRVESRRQPIHTIHVVIQIKGQKRKEFDYIQLFGTKMLHQVTDVGKYVKTFQSNNNEKLLLCCKVFPGIYDPAKSPTEICSLLTQTGLLNDGWKIIDCHTEHYVGNWIEENELDRVEQFLPKTLQIMRTRDLSKSIEYYGEKWLQ